MKEWAGKWIAHPLSHIPVESKPQVEEGERNAHYLFRHEFELGKVPEKAEMSLTGATWYRIWINGTFVEHGPIQSQVYYKFYNVRDVKQFLRPGRNAVAVEIYSTGKMFQAALLLEIRDETGRVLERSSGDWRSIPGEAWKKDVYFFGPSLYNPWQEIFDARRMPKGWKECGFDDSCWQKAKVYVDWRGSDIPPAVSPWLRLVERNIPFLREEVVYPKSVLELTECIHIRSLHRNPEDMSISLSAQGRKP
ncbi:MAG: alpha-L-rhamnosidase N-terminal domain-containing protein, partial [Victivallales bacterium]|nr:alpha-L-rhamnosidase N-terminal domain-containing protein [Victivallales bacterium]